MLEILELDIYLYYSVYSAYRLRVTDWGLRVVGELTRVKYYVYYLPTIDLSIPRPYIANALLA